MVHGLMGHKYGLIVTSMFATGETTKLLQDTGSALEIIGSFGTMDVIREPFMRPTKYAPCLRCYWGSVPLFLEGINDRSSRSRYNNFYRLSSGAAQRLFEAFLDIFGSICLRHLFRLLVLHAAYLMRNPAVLSNYSFKTSRLLSCPVLEPSVPIQLARFLKMICASMNL